jgi:signal transduction histidine kinase
MNRILLFISLALFGLLTSNHLLLAKDYIVNIDEVNVNGDTADTYYGDKIVISNSDSILFKYSVNPKLESDPILYRVMLIMGTDTSVNIISGMEVRYANLPQSDYKFIISAFDSSGEWNAKEDRFEFKVDNNLNSVLVKSNNLEVQIADLKKKLKELQENNGIVSIISDIALIILVTIILIFVVLFFKNRPMKKKKKTSLATTQKGVKVANSNQNDIALENANLKAELKALRMQIDKMQEQSRNLVLQNKGLQETLNVSNKSKTELEELQKQKEELFAVIVHDIKNPASVIKGLVDLLTNYDSTASDFEDIMKDIAASSSRILMLSSEISKIMALEGTGLKLHYEDVDINDIAQDVFTRNSYNAKNKNLTYECMFDNNLPEITLDVLRIDEVMDNLVSNAIKYTERSGSILVETTFDKEKNHIVFSVSDTGQGLSEEDIKSTFQKGATLSSKPTAGESATGLGLWIVKKMVEAHDGYVWVKSKKGEGSTFAFSIPVKRKIKLEDKKEVATA